MLLNERGKAMPKEKKDKNFIHKPIYEGGSAAMKQFVAEHLRYPEEAIKHKIEGTVHLKYDIDYLGNVTDAKVISGLGYGCDEEAIRVVKQFKFAVAKNRGIKVVFQKTIYIHFHLNKSVETKPIEQAQIPENEAQYQYLISTKTNKPKPESDNNGYSYTITW